MMNSIRLPKIKKKHHNLRECPKCGSFGIKLIEEVKKMAEEKEIKCQFCGKTFNKTDLVVKTETTDIFLGLNWGVPSWEEYEIGYCPDCRHPLMVNNKKIEYK